MTAASRDDTLPALCAVQVTFTEDTLMLAATDRYRAALRRLPWQPDGGPLPRPILVPAPALAEAARAGGQDPVLLHVVTGDDGVPAVAGFTSGLRTVTTRLTAAEYPALASKIPGEFAAIAVAGSAELTEAVKRLAIVAERETPIHLVFTPGQIELRAGSGDEATASDTVPCDLDGDPVTIAFQPRRLLDALASVGADRTRIALTAPLKPALITPATGDDSDGGGQGGTDAVYRHLLMPLRTAE
jgi:DNA polymerase III subunit beta